MGVWEMKRAVMAALVVATAMPATAAAQSGKQVPYWVSIAAREALMRTGPGTNYPATWRYMRRGLPLKVVQVHKDWRKVEDPEGEQGWIKSILLTDQRTVIVVGEVAALHGSADAGSRIEWRVAPGVIGKIDHCRNGWCEIGVNGRMGYIETQHLWGVAEGEVVK